MLQLVGESSCTSKVCRFNSRSGPVPRFWVQFPVRGQLEGNHEVKEKGVEGNQRPKEEYADNSASFLNVGFQLLHFGSLTHKNVFPPNALLV